MPAPIRSTIDYERLKMAHRAMKDMSEPTEHMYHMLQSLYEDRVRLGLEFRSDFKLEPEGELGQDFEGKLIKKDPVAIEALNAKINDVFAVVGTRLNGDIDLPPLDPKTIPKSDLEANAEMLARSLRLNEKLVKFYACEKEGKFDIILRATCPREHFTAGEYARALAALIDEKNVESVGKALGKEGALVGLGFIAADPVTGFYHIDAPLGSILSQQ